MGIHDPAGPMLPEGEAAALAQELFAAVRALSADGPGVSRPAYSDVETRVLDHLAGVARAEGLDVASDAGGNLVVSLPQDRAAARWALVGSHVDSVPQGGNFDGLAGVVAGFLLLIGARRSGRRLRMPVKCIALRAEESAWFGTSSIAARVLTGQLAPALLEAPHQGDGRTLAAHMQALGLETGAIAAGRPLADLSRIAAFVELHIEQGPVLAGRGLPAAIVTAIRGNLRHRAVRCIGEAGHAGVVPRAERRDPVMAFAGLLARLDAAWESVLAEGDDLVLTAGVVGTDPARHAMTRIADEIAFSLDIRSQSTATLDRLREVLRAEMDSLARRHGVRFEPGPELRNAPATMAPALVERLATAMGQVGLAPFRMPSGAGHDAAIFAQAGIPAGMIFVRNRNGSHNPDEAMEVADLLAGVAILSAAFAGPPA